MNQGLVCFAMWFGWGGASVGMNEGKVVSNGVFGQRQEKCFVSVLKKLGSNWFLVNCLDICTEDVCFVGRNLHSKRLLARIMR